MANVPESPTWIDGIYQLEFTDRVTGGVDGAANIQSAQLASRTAYLKQQVESMASVVGDKLDVNSPEYARQADLNNLSAYVNTVNAKVDSGDAALEEEIITERSLRLQGDYFNDTSIANVRAELSESISVLGQNKANKGDANIVSYYNSSATINSGNKHISVVFERSVGSRLLITLVLGAPTSDNTLYNVIFYKNGVEFSRGSSSGAFCFDFPWFANSGYTSISATVENAGSINLSMSLHVVTCPVY